MATAELDLSTAPAARTQRLDLASEQKQLLLAATAELIRATVTARTPVFPDPTLAGAASKTIAGAFVSLKRGRHLRSCCAACRNQPITLGKAVYEAPYGLCWRTCASRPCHPRSWSTWRWKSGCSSTRAGAGPRRRTCPRVITGGKHGLVSSAAQPGPAPAGRGRRTRLGLPAVPGAGLREGGAASEPLARRCHRPAHLEGEALRGRVGGAGDANAVPAHRPCYNPGNWRRTSSSAVATLRPCSAA